MRCTFGLTNVGADNAVRQAARSLHLPSREEAVAWAARIAKACRCDQELRVFGFDPQS